MTTTALSLYALAIQELEAARSLEALKTATGLIATTIAVGAISDEQRAERAELVVLFRSRVDHLILELDSFAPTWVPS